MLTLLEYKTFWCYAIVTIISYYLYCLTTNWLTDYGIAAIVNASMMLLLSLVFVFFILKTINQLQAIYIRIAQEGISEELRYWHTKLINKLITWLHLATDSLIIAILSIPFGLGYIRGNLFYCYVVICVVIFRFLILHRLIERLKLKLLENSLQQQDDLINPFDQLNKDY